MHGVYWDRFDKGGTSLEPRYPNPWSFNRPRADMIRGKGYRKVEAGHSFDEGTPELRSGGQGNSISIWTHSYQYHKRQGGIK
jgi:hypothetical protein